MNDLPMTDDELLAYVDAEVRACSGWMGGRLSETRKRSLDYYLGNSVGDLAPPEIDGRSQVISNETLATVEWMLPQLIRIFASGDSVVEFQPQSPEMQQQADDATEYVNYVFQRQNPGFMCLYSWFKDALLQKNGWLKVYWDTDETQTKERYDGLNDDELMLLMQRTPNGEIAAAEQVPQPDGSVLYNVEIAIRSNKSQVRVEPVPPEEVLTARNAKNLRDIHFIAHRRQMTIGELRALGYSDDLIDSIGTDDSQQLTQEGITRRAVNDEQAYQLSSTQASNIDPSARVIWITEAYARVDYDGDGVPEWRMIRKAGNTLLDNVETDGHPFVSITPIPLPHQLYGLSLADLTREPQRIKTAIMRAMLDNLYLTVNQRYGVVDGQVNLDDLLTSRPGGVVRMKTPGAVVPLVQPQGAQVGYQLLEYMTTYQENITGWTRYSQGTTADSLNHTATGINIITNKSDQRIELIARVFAETGVTDLFNLILKLIIQHQDATQVYLSGRWLNIDPTTWRDKFQLVINVGLGTGNKDQLAQQLMGVMQIQREAMQIGVADPTCIYNSATEYAKAAGFKTPEKFFTDPSKQPPQQPQPDPKAQELEFKRWQAEQDYQLQREKLEADIALRREELLLKYAPQLGVMGEAAIHQPLYQQSEMQVDDGQPDNAGVAGAGTWPAGGGSVGQPDLSGSLPAVAGGNYPGMGEQPGA